MFGLLRKPLFLKLIKIVLSIFLLTPSLGYCQNLIRLPEPGSLVPVSRRYSGPVLEGIRVDPKNPLNIEFVINTFDQRGIDNSEAYRLISYFFAGLTIPEDDLWVNLSPNEPGRIISQNTATTDLGKGLLEEDYILKKLASSLTYPEDELGKKYWDSIRGQVRATNIPVNMFNKVWIMPDKAVVYENKNAAFITEATLKVLAEEDYLAMQNNGGLVGATPRGRPGQAQAPAPTESFRKYILPQITQQVNQGEHFSQLRQVYNALILGVWFKNKLRDSLYKNYIEKNKIAGISLKEKNIKEKIYRLYVEACEKGSYNYVKTERGLLGSRVSRRQYYSGGMVLPVSRHTEFREGEPPHGAVANGGVRKRVSLTSSPMDDAGKVLDLEMLELDQRSGQAILAYASTFIDDIYQKLITDRSFHETYHYPASIVVGDSIVQLFYDNGLGASFGYPDGSGKYLVLDYLRHMAEKITPDNPRGVIDFLEALINENTRFSTGYDLERLQKKIIELKDKFSHKTTAVLPQTPSLDPQTSQHMFSYGAIFINEIHGNLIDSPDLHGYQIPARIEITDEAIKMLSDAGIANHIPDWYTTLGYRDDESKNIFLPYLRDVAKRFPPDNPRGVIDFLEALIKENADHAHAGYDQEKLLKQIALLKREVAEWEPVFLLKQKPQEFALALERLKEAIPKRIVAAPMPEKAQKALFGAHVADNVKFGYQVTARDLIKRGYMEDEDLRAWAFGVYGLDPKKATSLDVRLAWAYEQEHFRGDNFILYTWAYQICLAMVSFRDKPRDGGIDISAKSIDLKVVGQGNSFSSISLNSLNYRTLIPKVTSLTDLPENELRQMMNWQE